MLENLQLTRSLLCLGRESNPHGHCWPRDFLTTMAFATGRAYGPCLWSGLFLHRGAMPFRCVVSSLCTFLFPEAWLKIACRCYGRVSLNLRHSTSLFSESALKLSKSLVSTIPPPRRGVGAKLILFLNVGIGITNRRRAIAEAGQGRTEV